MRKYNQNKVFYCDGNIWKKIFFFKRSFVFKFAEKFMYNRAVITPMTYIGLNVFIYTGKRWQIRFVNQWMVGHKFGEFTWNRKIALYKSKQLKKKKLKQLKNLKKKNS